MKDFASLSLSGARHATSLRRVPWDHVDFGVVSNAAAASCAG
jgi:hypothetical protein